MGSQEEHRWSIGGHALYLQGYIGNNALTHSEGSGEKLPPSTSNFGMNLGYGWGFQLEANYLYNPKSDINLEWYHYRYSASTSRYLQQPGDWPSPAAVHIVQLMQSSVYGFSNKPAWDAVNIELGQFFTTDSLRKIKLHAGVQYARAANKSVLSGNFSTQNLFKVMEFNTEYNGFGPRFGIGFAQSLIYNFNIYAKGAAAILAGTNKSSTNGTNYGSGNYFYKNNSYMTIVPEADAQLGVNYAYAFEQASLLLDAGWMWVNYFDALKSSAAPLSLLGNFGVQGLYFGAKLKGDFV